MLIDTLVLFWTVRSISHFPKYMKPRWWKYTRTYILLTTVTHNTSAKNTCLQSFFCMSQYAHIHSTLLTCPNQIINNTLQQNAPKVQTLGASTFYSAHTRTQQSKSRVGLVMSVMPRLTIRERLDSPFLHYSRQHIAYEWSFQ